MSEVSENCSAFKKLKLDKLCEVNKVEKRKPFYPDNFNIYVNSTKKYLKFASKLFSSLNIADDSSKPHDFKFFQPLANFNDKPIEPQKFTVHISYHFYDVS